MPSLLGPLPGAWGGCLIFRGAGGKKQCNVRTIDSGERVAALGLGAYRGMRRACGALRCVALMRFVSFELASSDDGVVLKSLVIVFLFPGGATHANHDGGENRPLPCYSIQVLLFASYGRSFRSRLGLG